MLSTKNSVPNPRRIVPFTITSDCLWFQHIFLSSCYQDPVAGDEVVRIWN